MSVLSTAENDELGLGPAEIAVTRPRAAARSSLADCRAQVRRPEARGRAGGVRAGGVRLTRRGRTVLACFVITALTAAVVLLWLTVPGGARAASHAQGPGAAYQGLTRVVVRPGQTLWSIASRAEPAADPRIVIQQIIEVNALSGTVIQPGETLWVPRA
jgi:hypothetical protein